MKRNLPQFGLLKSIFIGALLLLVGVYSSLAAIVQVGSEQTAYVASQARLTVNIPAGTTIGDLLIINVIYGGNGGTSTPLIENYPNGWNVISSALSGDDTYRGTIFYKVVTNTWEDKYTIALSYYPLVSYGEASIVAFRGVDPSNPIDAIGNFTTTTSVSGKTIVPSGITTITPNALVVMLGMSYRSDRDAERSFDSWNANSPANLNEIYEYKGGNRVNVAAATAIKATPGPTGDGTITLSGNNTYRGAIMMALKPYIPSTPPACTMPVSPTSNTTGIAADASLTWGASPYATGYYLYFGTNTSANNIENGTDLGNVTSYTPSVTLDFLTDYYWQIVPYNSNGSATGCSIWTFKTEDINYCIPSGSNNLRYIDRVRIGSINNNPSGTGYSPNGYADYTGQSTDLIQGETNVQTTVDMNVNTSGSYGMSIWIDWNIDGDFNDAYENVVCDNSINNIEKVYSFDVPVGANLGYTRMRIRLMYQQSNCNDACQNFSYGEVEDYSVNVLPFCATPSTFSVSGGGSYCSGGTGATINLSGSETGVTYELYNNGVATGRTLPGGGSALTFSGVTVNGIYTVIATRTTGGCSATMASSATVTINTTPSAPSVGTITQPTCTVSTGSVTLNNLPSGNWTLTRNPGGIITNGSGTSTTITGLTNGTYTFTVTGENSSASCPGSGNGLKAEYFDNINLSRSPVLERIDPTVSYDWGGGGPGSPIANDYFSVRWTGKVQPCFTESYTFTTRSDDGIRLWVNGTPIIDNWTLHGSTYNSGSINLIAGQKYDIRLEFYENAGSAVAELYWSSASQANQIIPQTQLYYSETGCTSAPSSEVIINVQPSIPSAPTGVSSQTFCSLNNPTVANLLASGNGILWYDAASGGVSLQPSTALIDGRHYYASQTVGGCESTSRFDVTATVVTSPVASISYSGTPYCASGTANVTLTGQTGGTYSSTAGLSINSSNGAIDLLASTPGTYTVNYSFSNGTCSNTASTSLTINAFPTASINYSGTPFCGSGSAGVTQTGQTGGTYSSTTGLSINSSSGTINLSASTPGTYTVTYNFSNGFCSNTASTNVTIFALPAPTFIVSPGSDDCAFDEVVYTTQSGMSNYVWNIPGFLGSDYTIISGGTGPSDYTVTLKWITDSMKTVTVNYTDGNGCTGIPATSTVTIHPIPSIGSFN